MPRIRRSSGSPSRSAARPARRWRLSKDAVAEQIAQVADRAEVDLVVLALRGVPGLLGTRVGAVAYRVLCASPVPVLAVPHEARTEGTLSFLDAPTA